MYFLGTMFRTDLRSLAIFRIALGTIMIGDVVSRLQDFSAHYSQSGLHQIWGHDFDRLSGMVPLSRYLPDVLSQSTIAMQVLFCLVLIASTCLLLGYRTRFAIALSWLLYAILWSKNPAINGGGERALNIILIVSWFLPLGFKFSLDSILARNANARATPAILGPAAFCLMLLFVCIVSGSAIHKLSYDMWLSGDAVFLAMSGRPTILSGYVLGLPPTILRLLTHSTLGIELAAPALLFFTLNFPKLRLFVMGALAAMLLSIGSMMSVGILPVLTFALMLVFMREAEWSTLSRLSVPTRTPLDVSQKPAETWLRWASGFACSTLALLILVPNIRSIADSGPLLPSALRRVGREVGVYMAWRMFTGHIEDVSWLGYQGVLSDGTRTNAFSEKYPFERLEQAIDPTVNYRWRKFHEHISGSPPEVMKFSKYLCAKGRGLERVQVFSYSMKLALGHLYPVQKKPVLDLDCSELVGQK